MRTAIDLGIFQKLKDSKSALSAKQLAEATGAEEAFLGTFTNIGGKPSHTMEGSPFGLSSSTIGL